MTKTQLNKMTIGELKATVERAKGVTIIYNRVTKAELINEILHLQMRGLVK